MKVGFLGPFGTYTHQAAYECFQDSITYCEKTTIADTIESLETLDYAVVPRENSIFGSVVETFDGLRSLKEGFILGEIVLKIQHCLVIKKGAKLADIDCVMSHEQALGQCRKFIAEHLSSAATFKTTSTAAAAEAVSRSKTLNVAAICSKICTTMFGNLELVEEGIQDEDFNYTRFFVLGRNSLIKPPSYPTYPTRALIRVTMRTTAADSETSFDLTEFLKILNLSVIRIDRRPAPLSITFRDMYFLELQSTSKEDLWPKKVEQSVSRIRDNGFLAESIGLW
ncbi:PDT-domain-containing protein [Gymnopus androsaceus JB14]|uniref:prephenate dehydratase n=1 Tax=Gymnopus androsaceus JB14 TaxID=1447944 RepID=A0A6A4IKN5_9AGAR|nr:PDT-domain-containing protein [Gymnopus androsaceus JB14]